MRIPVFGSCPTDLSEDQFESKKLILGELDRQGIEWRSVGQTDYPANNPLTEVLMLARHCAGGVVLGFTQFRAPSGCFKPDTPHVCKVKSTVVMPTPWNHIESGLLFALGKPLIVFREVGIKGGVFDAGNTHLFIHDMPKSMAQKKERQALRELVQRFAGDVRAHYYKI
jgi:hypothetical protein